MTELVPAGAVALFALASGYATLTVYGKEQAIAAAGAATVDSLTPASGTSLYSHDGWVQ